MEREMFSIQEVAERWSVSKDSVRRAVDAGKIRDFRFGARRMIPRAEIERCELLGAVTSATHDTQAKAAARRKPLRDVQAL